MTQKEEILVELRGSETGLTQTDLEKILKIPGASLRQVLYEIKRDRLSVVTGRKGSYRHKITDKGLEYLREGGHQYAKPRLGDISEHIRVKGEAKSTMPEHKKLDTKLEEYNKLRHFTSYLLTSRREELQNPGRNVEDVLKRATLEYIGVRPDELYREIKELEALHRVL